MAMRTAVHYLLKVKVYEIMQRYVTQARQGKDALVIKVCLNLKHITAANGCRAISQHATYKSLK